MFKISELSLTQEYVKRDGAFNVTLFPDCDTPNALCYLGHKKFAKKINNNPNISVVVTTENLAAMVDDEKGLIVHDKPGQLYYDIHNFLAKNNEPLVRDAFIHPSAVIAETAILKGNVIIEEGVVIEDYVVIYENTIVGKNTYIGAGAILGNMGMQNIRVDGINYKVKFLGGVKIGENCEILSRAMIQKPYHAFFTTIGNNAKISVKTSVGHGSSVGNNTLIAGGCTVAGNVTIGNDVWIGPGSTIRDGISIGDNAKVMFGSNVAQSIRNEQVVSGSFALDHKKNLQNLSKLKKL